MPKPDPLYYIKYGQYTVTNSEICPDDFSFLIEEKKKCIDDCQNDDKYKYTYEGKCYEAPPEYTNDDDEDFICKDNPNKCIVTRNILYTSNLTITDEEVEILTSKYAKEFNYTNNHISIYENDIYIITIYKNGECSSDLGILSKTINFEDCSDEIKTKKNIPPDTNLIIVQIETKPGKEKYKKNPSYDLYHPETGESLNYLDECKDKTITLQNNITEEINENSKLNLNDIKLMADEGINLFDISSPFYNDLCTHYPDILNKDIPLNKRILAYYPDIKLCDENCELISIFLNNLTSKCECIVSKDIINKNEKMDREDFYKKEIGELEELIYSTNINVVKCYKELFVKKYFIKCYGSFIILGFILIQIICTIFYFCKSKLHLRKYFFSIINKYLNFLKDKQQKNDIQKYILKKPLSKGKIVQYYYPPRRYSKNAPTIFVKKQSKDKLNLTTKNNIKSKSKKSVVSVNVNTSNEKVILNNSSNTSNKCDINSSKKRNSKLKDDQKFTFENNTFDSFINNMKDEYNIYIEEFIKTDPQDMDYDDALRRDKRAFCQYYREKIMTEQIILNTFFYKEYLKPQPIKIMLLILQIDLYFFINALFYNEEYVTKIFELEKDSFSKAFCRFLDNLFYAFIVGVIINYIIEFFFIQEKKLRVTLKNEKDNLLSLKYEMMQIIKDLEKRYLSFIIISFIISLFILYHITCFNNIYPHMKKEWLIFSVLIIVCVQIISLIKSFIETILRFMSFRCKSEKLFKLSLIFS